MLDGCNVRSRASLRCIRGKGSVRLSHKLLLLELGSLHVGGVLLEPILLSFPWPQPVL